MRWPSHWDMARRAEQACNNQNMISGRWCELDRRQWRAQQLRGKQSKRGNLQPGLCQTYLAKRRGRSERQSRDLPDISLFASNGFLGSFYLICQQDRTGGCDLNSFAGYGGTSVASPAFAGIMSLVNQKMGAPQGVPGFVLYKLETKQPNAFHDIPSGSTIAMPCLSGSPNCTVIYYGRCLRSSLRLQHRGGIRSGHGPRVSGCGQPGRQLEQGRLYFHVRYFAVEFGQSRQRETWDSRPREHRRDSHLRYRQRFPARQHGDWQRPRDKPFDVFSLSKRRNGRWRHDEYAAGRHLQRDRPLCRGWDLRWQLFDSG